MIDERKLLALPLHSAVVLLGIAVNNYHSLVTAQAARAATGQLSFARSMLIGMAIESSPVTSGPTCDEKAGA